MHPIAKEIEAARVKYREGNGEEPIRIFIPENRLDDLKYLDNTDYGISKDRAHIYICKMRLCVGGETIHARGRELPQFNYMDTRND